MRPVPQAIRFEQVGELVKCVVGQWLTEDCDDEDREALAATFEGGVSMAALHRHSIAAGLHSGLTAFKDHLRSRCGCFKE